MPRPDDLVTEVHPKSVSVSLDRVELSVVDGPDRGQARVMPLGNARIGKAPGCHLTLSDRMVSRIHCEIRITRTGVRVIDRASTNGTYVDGVRVYEAEIGDGAILRLGESSVAVSIDRGKERLVLAPLDQFGPLVGSSAEMRAIYALIPSIAQSEATTLIQGETGTGKELVARAIHGASPRAEKPFVVIDCAGLSPSLIESDLFGHVRGAFTGAIQNRPGLFEAAHGGTVFIDEITDLPLALQPRLLRVLEAREVRRVGANSPTAVDVHVIAAASRPLAECVNAGSFREDLFYRLAVAEIFLPPLRARADDAARLALHFWHQFVEPGREPPPELVPAVRARGFPGNVRELRNFVERVAKLGWAAAPAHATARGDLDVPADLPLKEARRVWNERFDELYARAVLARAGGNVTRAAEIAGVNRRSLQRMFARDKSGDEDDGTNE
jgi:transcriptional regulator with GAF, ATPase, and Fis domain